MRKHQHARLSSRNRQKLEEPFTQEQIRHREGAYGKTLSYLEGHSVIARLNHALDGSWSFVIRNSHINHEADEVIVHACLNAAHISKEAFGACRIRRYEGSGRIIDLGSDMKAAATDALKKCASMLGVGLHLYQGAHNNNSSTHEPAARPQPNGRTPPAHENSIPEERMSTRQHNYILKLAEQRNISETVLDQLCEQEYATEFEILSKQQASALIEHLRTVQDNGVNAA